MPLHADLALARRIEEAESALSAEFALAADPSATVVVPVAGGRAVFAGVGGTLTEAKALGMAGPVTDADLDRLEEVYFTRASAAKVWACPLADGSLLEVLGRRGYRPVEFETILVRTLADLSDLPAPSAGIEVRPAGRDEDELYADVVARAFVHPAPAAPEFLELIRAGFGLGGTWPFLALIEGRVVGGGMVVVRDGLAFLAGAATAAEYRNRGVQTALSHARLHHARQLGCGLVVQGAGPGTASQRTAERLGLRVAYTKLALRREPS